MRTEAEQMLAGEPYEPVAPELIANRERASDLAFEPLSPPYGDH